MSSKFQKIVGASALGALSTLDLMYSQHASAVASFTGSTVANPKGGSVQVAITVDGTSGVYRITSISTPVQPTGQNAPYASLAIPTLTSEALSAQSANITAVSGASQISAAWKSSLSSAISAAAAGGQPVGGVSIVATPTPTPTPVAPTPTPVATPPASGGGATSTPVATTPAVGSTTPNPAATTSTSTASQGTTFTPGPLGIPASLGAPPSYHDLFISPYVPPTSTGGSGSTANLSSYVSQISSILSTLPSQGATNSGTTALNNARSALSSLRNQIQNAANQPATQSTTDTGYIAYVNSMNTQVKWVVDQANKALADWYIYIQSASNNLYMDAQSAANKMQTDGQAAADKLVADAQAAADKLTADAKATADKLVADAQARADAIKASPAPTVTVTATPKSQAITISLKPGVVIKKTFTCTKLYLGKPVSIVVKDVVVKCPSGYSLAKK